MASISRKTLPKGLERNDDLEGKGVRGVGGHIRLASVSGMLSRLVACKTSHFKSNIDVVISHVVMGHADHSGIRFES